jgi:glutamyl-tRNA synthetase
MRVNTVIRGDEWLPSAPLHIQLFNFLGVALPDFAHVAPIAKMDGSSKRKLSKRKDPEANLRFYNEAGYPVQAVIEYLLNLANSSFYDWRVANPEKPYTEFTVRLEDMGVAMPLFDLVKLNDISKDVIATYSAEQVYQYAVEWALQYNAPLAAILQTDPAYSISVFNVERVGPAPRKDIINWSDVERACGFYFDELYEASIAANGYPMPPFDAADIAAILQHIAGFNPEVSKDVWLEDMRSFAESLNFSRDAKTFKKNPGMYKGHFGDVMMVVRVALTGRTNTPDLYETLRTFGQERIRQRVAQALERSSS